MTPRIYSLTSQQQEVTRTHGITGTNFVCVCARVRMGARAL